jgi:hypothetical protein
MIVIKKTNSKCLEGSLLKKLIASAEKDLYEKLIASA